MAKKSLIAKANRKPKFSARAYTRLQATQITYVVPPPTKCSP